MTEPTNTPMWKNALIIAGASVLLLGSGGAVAATLPQALNNAPSIVAASDEPTDEPTTTNRTAPSNDADDNDNGPTDPTDTGTGGSSGGGSGQSDNGPAAPPAAAPPAAQPEPPAPVEEEPPYIAPTPGPVYPNISANGDGSYYASWGDPDTRGATIAYYWVDVVDPGYTTGDRITPVYGNGVSFTPSAGLNCVVVAAVSTEGIQGDVSGPYCF